MSETMNFKTILLAGILAAGNSFVPTPAPASEDRQVSSMNECHRRHYRHRHYRGAYYNYHYYPRRVVSIRWGPFYYQKFD